LNYLISALRGKETGCYTLYVNCYMLFARYWVLGTGYWACHVKCDACPACPVRKNDCVGVKFEVRKHFTREGAYFTVVLVLILLPFYRKRVVDYLLYKIQFMFKLDKETKANIDKYLTQKALEKYIDKIFLEKVKN